MKDWSTLERGDKLFIIIPKHYESENNVLEYLYEYQECAVINTHQYDTHINIRFKFTNARGKRQRIELSINKTKYNDICVAVNKRTGWAAQYEPKYGDIVVTYISSDELQKVYYKLIDAEKIRLEKIIDETKNKIRILNDSKWKKI